MIEYHQEGDPFEEGKHSVTRYEGQKIARRSQSDVINGDRRLDPSPQGLLERWFGGGAARAIKEARDRAEQARAMKDLAISRGDAQIAVERMIRAPRIGVSRAEAEIAANEADLANSLANRQQAITRGKSAAALAEMDIEIARLKRDNEILRLRQEGDKLRNPPPSKQTEQSAHAAAPEPDHPLVTEMKAELRTYQQVRLELRKLFDALEARRDTLDASEYEHRREVLEIAQAQVISRISAGL